MDPLRIVQVLVLALLQGATELFPVSSLGHTVIIPGLVGWGDLLRQDTFLPIVVTLHLGTSVALILFYWRDWVKLIGGGVRVVAAGKFTPDVDPEGYGRQLALVVVGTIPAGLLGVFLQKPLEKLFGQPILASAFLVANGAVLLTAERLWRDRVKRAAQQRHLRIDEETIPRAMVAAQPKTGEIGVSINQMTFTQALLVGTSQALALLPGISRSGSTMVGGLLSGLSHEASARFSFLLATPIILAAGLVEVPKLFGQGNGILELALVGGVLSGVVAFFSVRFLTKYFENRRLEPFAYYCIGAGLLAFTYFLIQYLRGGN
ncbi:MAG: undecaprenyl-diphosphate phosphatase [Ktedonobacterales bacterium]|nr:undecaprenyl-diphosphate phosphatase [Ktedonobacterales bacterium]